MQYLAGDYQVWTWKKCQVGSFYSYRLIPQMIEDLIGYYWVYIVKELCGTILLHPYFLEHWNRQKILSDIWQCFSCLLDESIPKNANKKNHCGVFLKIHFIHFEMHMDRPDKSENIFGRWYITFLVGNQGWYIEAQILR